MYYVLPTWYYVRGMSFRRGTKEKLKLLQKAGILATKENIQKLMNKRNK